MTLIEKIEKALTYTTTNDDNKLFIFESVFNESFSNDKDFVLIKENVDKVIDFYNSAENKKMVENMEVSEILKLK